MFLSNYVAIAGRNLTVDNLKQKLELYIIDTENQLRTHASSLFNSIASSGGCIQEILLPLLSSEHAQEVILDLANQNQENAKSNKNTLATKFYHQGYHWKYQKTATRRSQLPKVLRKSWTERMKEKNERIAVKLLENELKDKVESEKK
ncbi:2389_t:CDS:2, partial [Entrophospora sp. SA101]